MSATSKTCSSQFDERLENFVARRLPAKLDSENLRSKELYIHDPVWGTISLSPPEVALLDTEIFQRLRRIKQLAGAHLIFPGALHSRFEHSLGVTHLVGRMCQGLKRNHGEELEPTATQIDALRFAAMCHDLGHGPFSHSSEEIFQKLEPFPNLLGPTGGQGAAELMSILIVQSAPMQTFLAQLAKHFGIELDSNFLAAAIGGNLQGAQHHLGEIIHGPFDADKLDYLTRDGQCCGIPLRPDSEKIYATLEVVNEGNATRLVCGRKAAAALMQIVHHKQHMFAVVYQHEVLRIFTAMLTQALDFAIEDATPINGNPLVSPVDLIELDDEMLLAPGVVEPASRAAKMLELIRQRKLYKVAAAFGHNKRKMIEGNEDNLRAQIADVASVAKDEVLLNIAPRIANQEAGSGLVRTEDGVHKLIECMPQLQIEGVGMFNQLERHLVLCPARHRSRVHAAAQQLLGDLI